MIKRSAKAIWRNDVTSGQGELTTLSSALRSLPYSFTTRFKNEDGRAGTNPEELIAAAHAGCYSMALSAELGKAGFSAPEIETDAFVFMDKIGDGFAIRKVELETHVQADDIEPSRLEEIANTAKTNCPVSKALAVPVELKVDIKEKSPQRDSGKREPTELLT